MPTVRLANATNYECSPEQTLLEAARLQGLALEHSCRTGRCGTCKAHVLRGATKPLMPEESLSDKERAEGVILTCCRAPLSCVELDIEDLGELGRIRPKTLPCRIDSLRRVSSDVIELTLRTPPNAELEYVPGQYVEMIGRDSLRRSYSIANAPRKDGKLTLQIRKVANGQMSRYWFEQAGHDDLLRLEGPFGTFSLRRTSVSQLVLLATGTGIAPLKAMLEQLASYPEKNSYEQIHLYWGGRVEEDLYWRPEFPELSIRFVPVISRSNVWAGARGHVQDVLLADQVDLNDSVVYACGSEAMIASARQSLTAAGLEEKRFYSDAFVSSD